MFAHIVRRLLLAIPTMFAVLTVIFIIVRVAPGDPATAMLGDAASQEAVEALKERMGLNVPIYQQYVNYLSDLAKGDLGDSLKTGQPVWYQIRSALPHTLELTFAAMIIGLVTGVPIGIITAVKRNQAPDYVGRLVSLVGLSLPSFYFGILLMYFFAVRLDWFPAVGAPSLSDPAKNLQHLVLPAITLGLIETAYISRMTRSAMIAVLEDDYIRTARAKGLRERVVLLQHGLRSGLLPIVSLIGIFAIGLIGSSVLVEEVFARPGLGKLMVGATKQKDYTSLQSIMVVYAFIIVLINIAVDILYTWIDPRVRY